MVVLAFEGSVKVIELYVDTSSLDNTAAVSCRDLI